jgi:hypothetical protein
LFAVPLDWLKPRAVIPYVLASSRATWRFGASRRTSGMLFAPERRIASFVMTKTAAAAWFSGSATFETEVTLIWASSSIESRLRSCADAICS